MKLKGSILQLLNLQAVPPPCLDLIEGPFLTAFDMLKLVVIDESIFQLIVDI